MENTGAIENSKTEHENVVSGSPDVNTNQQAFKADPIKPKTEEIDISKMTNENPDTISVDWGASEKGKENAFFTGPTKPVADAPKNASGSSSTAPSSGASFTIGIKVLIAVIDFIISNVLCKVAGDKHASSYTADKESKNNLQDSLIMILEENRVKIPTWLVVLFAFLAAYGFQIMGAINTRKNKLPEAKANDKDPITPGLFQKDGKTWRRYANGNVREAKFDENGTEILIGQPTKYSSRRKAA